jgi:hypothetical protein
MRIDFRVRPSLSACRKMRSDIASYQGTTLVVPNKLLVFVILRGLQSAGNLACTEFLT